MKLTINPLATDIIKPEPITIDFDVIAKAFIDGVKQVADQLIKWAQPIINYDYQMERWVASLPTRGWIQDGYAYLIVRDDTVPGRWVIIKDEVPIDILNRSC